MPLNYDLLLLFGSAFLNCDQIWLLMALTPALILFDFIGSSLMLIDVALRLPLIFY